MIHFMIDIETTALSARAGVWQVAMCEFSLRNGTLLGPSLCDTLDWTEQKDRVVDPDTVAWTEDKGAASEFYEWDWGVSATNTVAGLHDDIRGMLPNYEAMPYMLWCKGAKFDFAILQDLFAEVLKRQTPWHYRSETCLRTAAQLYRLKTGEAYKFDTASHHAAEDVKSQAIAAAEIMGALY